MRKAKFAKTRERLWPKGPNTNIWAVVDCAAHPGLYGALLDSYNISETLYRGELDPDLERVSPHLVQLDYDDERFTGRLLEHAFGDYWGIAFRSDSAMVTLKKHLRRLLTVQDYSGRRLLFRFYDPRVLRVYLPTCVTSELDEVYGPIKAFMTESAEPEELLVFGREKGQLVTEKLLL